MTLTLVQAMTEFEAQVEAFAARLSADQQARATQEIAEHVTRQGEGVTEATKAPVYADLIERRSTVKVTYRTKYVLVDVETSGKYMIPIPPAPDAGTIYGIKGYGVIHRGHVYGTLATAWAWNWGGYVAFLKPALVAV